MSTKVMQQPWLWKRFTSDAIATYKGVPGEPIIDLRTGTPQLRLCDGVTLGGNPVNTVAALAGVAIPSIVAPLDESVEVALQPAFTGSQFNGVKADGSADTHAASTWEVATDEAFTTIVHSSGRSTAYLTNYDMSAAGVVLAKGTVYYVRVTYEGVSGYKATSGASKFTSRRFVAPEYQLQKLLADGGTGYSVYGVAVAFSGDGNTAFVGACNTDVNSLVDAGVVFVYAKNSSGSWVQQAKLTAPTPAVAEQFGIVLAPSYDGKTLLIGTQRDQTEATGAYPGVAYVFTFSGTAWTRQATLAPAESMANDLFGRSVSLSRDGNIAIVGAPCDSRTALNKGAVYVFVRSGTTWTQQARLLPADTLQGDQFGYAVSLSSDASTLVVGALYADTSAGADAGAAYIYLRNGTAWTQQAKVTANDGQAGDVFGVAVAVSANGETFAVGSYRADSSSIQNSGAVYVFARNGSVWAQQAKLKASDEKAGANLGFSVSISADGDTVLAGADAKDSTTGTEPGAAYAFGRTGTGWAQARKLTSSDGAAKDQFGYAVALSSDAKSALIGVFADADQGAYSGSAYFFK